ncbi:Unknown protein, partial [Striga hermonthica]
EYARWKKADEMEKCYILASISNVLQHQHQSKNTAADILINLRNLFGHQSRAARQEPICALMTTRMAVGTPVREHALEIMALFNELEVMKGFIDEKTQVDILLQSLPKSFYQFRLNHNMHKMHMALPELLAELQSLEALFTQAPHVLVAEQAGPSRPHKGKKRKKSTGKAKVQDAPVVLRPTPRAVAKKPKGRFHKCNKSGHWKVDYHVLKKGHARAVKRKREEVGITAHMPVKSFKAEDAEGVVLPHNDALVITAEVVGFNVKSVFIDTGSSMDVMFYDCFVQINKEVNMELKPVATALYGFNGGELMPMGEISLSVALGSGVMRMVRMVRFVVVGTESSYNIIMGRTSLNSFQ